jgi:hypothetical protein
MSCQIDGDLLISYLVSVAINAMANSRLQDTLNRDIDSKTLKWFKGQLDNLQARKPSAKASYINDFLVISKNKKGKIKDIPVQSLSDNAEEQKRLAEIIKDEALLNKSFEYWEQYIKSAAEAFDMSYLDAHKKLKELNERLAKDVKTKPEAVLTSAVAPAGGKIVDINIRSQTHDNAVRTAVDIYIKYAQDSKLPGTLPQNCPRDMFSGKDFIYEKTNEGFVLRCQVKDMDKNIVQEYAFKLKR